MATLWILGAGCSRNYDQGTTGVPGLQAPLNGDFFIMSKRLLDFFPGLIGAHPGAILGLHHLINELNRLYNYAPSEDGTTVFKDPRLTLEGVMNYFYLKDRLLEYASPSIQSESSRTRALSDLLNITLTESLRGPPCDKHLAIAHQMKRGDVIFSLNYDLLMDNALYAAGRMNDSGYNVRFDSTYVNGHWKTPDQERSDIVLLKLHGSLNWVRCQVCGRNLLLRGAKGTPTPLITLSNTELKCPRCKADWFTGLERIIIPPAALKDFQFVDIRYLWSSAQEFCRDVDRIVAIGYRFSETDSELEMLLRTFVAWGTLPRKPIMTIVNPHPKSVIERFESIFPESSPHIHQSLRAFLKHGCGA